MIVGVPYDAEIEYLMLNDQQIVVPVGCIPVRIGSIGYLYNFATRTLSDRNNDYVLGPDVATPAMGLRRYPQIRGAA